MFITRSLSLAVLALVCLAAALPLRAQTTYTVTKTGDTNDGVCNADCSLREAIAAANANAIQDRIAFAPALAGRTISLAPGRGQLAISQRVTIDTEGADITVDARGRSRVFFVGPGFNEVSMVGLTITGGRTAGAGGGLLASDDSEIALTRCTVTGNESAGGGGGVAGGFVFVYDSTISDNATAGEGGGLLSFFGLIVDETTVSGNSAGGSGGGIRFPNFFQGGERLLDVTVTRNDSQGQGGGVAIDGTDFFSTAARLLVAGNTRNGDPSDPAADCAEPLVGVGSSLAGAGTGCGNTAATVAPEEVFTRVLDPLLADNGEPTRTHALLAPGGDPSLNPAIALGAGAGSFPPGGSAPAVTVSLVPEGAPVTVPAGGGAVTFTATLANTTGQTLSFEVWSAAALPDNTLLVPLFGPVAVTLGPGQTLSRRLMQTVPGIAPAGAYTYVGYAGDFATRRVEDRSSFGVSKAAARGTASARYADWTVVDAGSAPGVTEAVRGQVGTAVPGARWLGTAFPNPFSQRTTLALSLPEAAEVRLAAYDVLGRAVAVLASGWHEAGQHTVTLDADGLTGGVYLVRLTAGEHAETRRVVVAK